MQVQRLCLRRPHFKPGHPAEFLVSAIVELQAPLVLVRLGRPEGWEPLAAEADLSVVEVSNRVAFIVPSVPPRGPGGWVHSGTLL